MQRHVPIHAHIHVSKYHDRHLKKPVIAVIGSCSSSALIRHKIVSHQTIELIHHESSRIIS